METRRRTLFAIGYSNSHILNTNIKPRLPSKDTDLIWITCCTFTNEERWNSRDFILGFSVNDDNGMYFDEAHHDKDSDPWKADYLTILERIRSWLAKYGLILNVEDSKANFGTDQFIYADFNEKEVFSLDNLGQAAQELLTLLGVTLGENIIPEISFADFVRKGQGDHPSDWQEIQEYIGERYLGHPPKASPSCCIIDA